METVKLIERSWQYKNVCNDEFTVMQFNCLADGLAQTGDFKYCSEVELEWANRWNLMQEEITTVNPDVLCIQ